MNKKSNQVTVGVGGWEHEIFDDCFYPQRGLDSMSKLALYSRSFDFVEVRHTFWDETVTGRDVEDWVAAVSGNRRFQFSVKLHSSITHKKLITPRVTRTVRGVLHSLLKYNRLTGLLAQFPCSFTNTGANRFHLTKLGEIFSGFPLFVELRHASWDIPGFGEFFAENLLQPVNVDLPRMKQLMPCRGDVQGKTAYLRLHGRNDKGWLLNGFDTRYDYLYNDRELREIRRRVDRLSEKSASVVVALNNTTSGKAIANALQLAHHWMGGTSIPEKSVQVFSFLKPVGDKKDLQTEILAGEGLRKVG